MQSINALFPYTWADFQSFGFSSFAWFVLRGVLNVFSWRASWILRSMTWFFTVALFLIRREKKKSFLVSLESVHYLSNKSGYRCLCNCSTAVNCFIFRTLKKKKKVENHWYVSFHMSKTYRKACVDNLGIVQLLHLESVEWGLYELQLLLPNSMLPFLLLGVSRSWGPHQQFVL